MARASMAILAFFRFPVSRTSTVLYHCSRLSSTRGKKLFSLAFFFVAYYILGIENNFHSFTTYKQLGATDLEVKAKKVGRTGNTWFRRGK